MAISPISGQRAVADYRSMSAAREKSAANSDGLELGLKNGSSPTAAGGAGGVPPVAAKDSRSENGKDGVGCETCKERKYQDGSNDPGVSFKSPTNVDPSMAASAVAGHEQEHVTREQFKAMQQDRKVVSQSVAIHNAICPECGRTYVSGGTTRTVTKADTERTAAKFNVGKPGGEDGGKLSAAG